MKTPFLFFFIFSLLMCASCTNQDDGIPADGAPCPGEGPFIVQGGACVCPPGFVLAGKAPSVLGGSPREGVCVPYSEAMRPFLVSYNDCKCTELTNNTSDTLVLIFDREKEGSNAMTFVQSIYINDRLGTYGMISNGHFRLLPEGEELTFRLINTVKVDLLRGDCEELHEGLHGQFRVLFPHAEEQVEAKIIWWPTWAALLGDGTPPVDSCRMVLERIAP
jgi:hypothetical protein